MTTTALLKEAVFLYSHVRSAPTAGSGSLLMSQQSIHDNLARLTTVGALVNAEAFMASVGVSGEQLESAVAARKLFRVEMDGKRWYPAFYADPSLNRAELEHVCSLLGDVSAAVRWLFFTTPRGSLAPPPVGVPRTPLDALRAGAFDQVVKTASAFATR